MPGQVIRFRLVTTLSDVYVDNPDQKALPPPNYQRRVIDGWASGDPVELRVELQPDDGRGMLLWGSTGRQTGLLSDVTLDGPDRKFVLSDPGGWTVRATATQLKWSDDWTAEDAYYRWMGHELTFTIQEWVGSLTT